MRVLLVAQKPLVRAGLRGLIQEGEHLAAGEAASFEEAARLVRSLSIDAVLAELVEEALEDILTLLESLSTTSCVVVLLGEPTSKTLRALLEAGAKGILPPSANAQEASAALLSAQRGLFVSDPRLLQLAFTQEEAEELSEGEGLTEREREVLSFLALGWPNRMIATKLQISEHTVKFHVASLLTKLGASSRTEAVTRAVRKGVLAL